MLTPESRVKVIAGNGIVATKLTGADFQFFKSRGIQGRTASIGPRADARRPAPQQARRQQHTVDVDTAASGASVLLRTQSGGSAQEPPLGRLSRPVRLQARDNGPYAWDSPLPSALRFSARMERRRDR